MQSYIVLSFGKVCSACALRVASTTHALTLRAFGKIEWSSNILMLSHEGLKHLLEPFHLNIFKVEKIEEDSLGSIPSPSPSMKIQIIGGKVYLR